MNPILARQAQRKLTFSKHGALLIVSRTNSFRSLCAEAFLKSAIEKNIMMMSTMAKDHLHDDDHTNHNNVKTDDFLLTNVVSVGQEHVPAKAGAQLHPLAKKLLVEQHGIAPELVDSLWCKTISSVRGRLGTFDAIVSIVDGDGGGASGVDETDNINAASSSEPAAATGDDDDPFFSIPGMRPQGNNDDNDKVAGSPSSSSFLATTPSHWKPSNFDGSLMRKQYKIYSPVRDGSILKNSSQKRFQDDYAGEPQFHVWKKLSATGTKHALPASTKFLRWVLPGDVSKRKPMETEAEHEARAAQVVKNIARLCNELLS